MKFIHTADWQLGMTRHFLSTEAQARFSQARIDAITTIGAVAAAEHASFVIVCGDVFESNHVARQVVVRALEAMGRCVVPIYLLPGNHDPLDAASVFRSPTFTQHCPANVVVLESSEVVVDPGSGVELVPAPWFSKRPLSDLVTVAARELPPVPPSEVTLRVAVGHGAVDSVAPDIDNPAIIRLADLDAALAEHRLHYVALGDRHSTTSVGTSGRVWYAGAPEPTDYDETDPGNVLVVELTSTQCDVAPVSTGTWAFARSSFDLNNADDVVHLLAWLDGHGAKDRCIVKLSLVGTLTLQCHAALLDGLAHQADLFGAIEQWDRHTDLAVLPDDADFSSIGLSGFAADALADLRHLASPPGPDAVVAVDALALLFRLSGAAA